MASTPEEWLHVLAKEQDARAPRIAKNRRYSEGKADLPEMGDNLRESWEAFQKKARTDYGGLLCSSIAGRTIPLGFRLGGDAESTGALALRRLWRNLRLYTTFVDAVWNAYATGYGYVLTTVSDDGSPLITSEKPEQMITRPDPAQPWRARAAMKAWRDPDTGKDYATVWIPGQMQRFYRDSKNANGTPYGSVAGDQWEPLTEVVEFEGGVPVHLLENLREAAEFEPHIDLIDRINLGKLNRLVVTAMQAFKQRAVKGIEEGDEDEEDETGNDSDLERMFSAAPGAIWDLPAGVDIWESDAVDIRPLLEGEKSDARDLAAVTRRAISVFIPDGANQSAEGAASAKEGEIQIARDRIERFSAPLEAAAVDALRILRIDTEETVEIVWQPPEHVSLSEKTSAATQAKGAGVSQRWINERILGMSPEEAAEEEANRAAESLALALATQTITGGTTEVTESAVA